MRNAHVFWSVELKTKLPGFWLDVHLREPNGVLAVVGENGSGKTTLLRAMLGVYAQTTGKIRLGERVLLDTDSGLRLPIQERGFAYVPQGGGLFPHLSVTENVLFGTRAKSGGEHGQTRNHEAIHLLAELGCAHLANRDVTALSGGERQKIALARALMSQPDFLLLDEPLAALDVRAKSEVRTFLGATLSRLSIPSIVVTHDARDAEILQARVCVIAAGRVSQVGSMDEVRSNPTSDFARVFCEDVAFP